MSVEFLVTSFVVVVTPGIGVLYTMEAGLARGVRPVVLDIRLFIDHRQLSMVGSLIPRGEAELYAEWFRALADATRVQLVAWLAQQPGPVSVGELTAVLPVGQSTVSHHLAALAEVGFVQLHRRGTSSLYAVNPNCLDCFPSAADVVMGRRPPDAPPSSTCAEPRTDTGSRA